MAKIYPSTINELAGSIGTYHLADHPDLYEPQRSNNFEFIVTDLNGILKPGMLGTESNPTIPNATDVIRLTVSSASVPHFNQDIVSIRRGNNELKYAGVPTFNEGKLEVIDYIGVDTVNVLMAWQNLSYNVKTEKVGLAKDYKKSCYLVEYSPDYQIVRTWKLYGCWISSISEPDFSSDTSGKRTISCTIQYDRGEIDTSDIV